MQQMMNAIENMQNRLVMTEKALVDARAATAPQPKTAGLVDTQSIGKAPNFSGEHKVWHDWSFQFTAHRGSANPRAIGSLRLAGTREAAITTEESYLIGRDVSAALLRAGYAVQGRRAYDHQERHRQQRLGRLEGLVRALRPREQGAATCPHAAAIAAEEARTCLADGRGS